MLIPYIFTCLLVIQFLPDPNDVRLGDVELLLQHKILMIIAFPVGILWYITYKFLIGDK